MLRRRDEIVEDVLFELQHAAVVPRASELESTANIGNGVNTTLLNPQRSVLLHPKRVLAHKGWQPDRPKATIAGKQRGIVSIQPHVLAMDDVHRPARSIRGFIPLLLHDDVAG